MRLRLRRVGLLAVVAGGIVAAAGVLSGQQPTFRSAVDLIAVEAQVVDRDGAPIAALRPEDFEVSIRGQRRRVVSADFEEVERANTDVTAGGTLLAPAGLDASPARTFIIAIDTSSFDTGAARAPLEAARVFVSSLPPADKVGLYVYPNGPRIEPGTGRALLRQRLGEVLGNRNVFEGIYHLRPSEVIDITASTGIANPVGLAARARTAVDVTAAQIEANPLLGVQARECPADPSARRASCRRLRRWRCTSRARRRSASAACTRCSDRWPTSRAARRSSSSAAAWS